MTIQEQVKQLDALVANGQIIEAVSTYFADEVQTQDFDGTITSDKAAMLSKMNGFLGAIQQVNGITHHQTTAGDNVSFSEFTFDFDMKDGSKILWHEILRREWKDGKVIHESHFKN